MQLPYSKSSPIPLKLSRNLQATHLPHHQVALPMKRGAACLPQTFRGKTKRRPGLRNEPRESRGVDAQVQHLTGRHLLLRSESNSPTFEPHRGISFLTFAQSNSSPNRAPSCFYGKTTSFAAGWFLRRPVGMVDCPVVFLEAPLKIGSPSSLSQAQVGLKESHPKYTRTGKTETPEDRLGPTCRAPKKKH